MRPLLLAALLLTTAVLRAADPAPFDILDGDRILLLGDTLLEREGTYGYLETRIHEQFPTRHFTVRNLAFSADTPRGWSRASFDPVEKGWDRLKEQIASVRPTVVILGYGMAASLQQITDESGDISLNPDPARYGTEPMSPARFKRELGDLMNAISANASTLTPPPAAALKIPSLVPITGSTVEALGATAAAAPTAVRFILLGPIRHEDLRATRPGLPDPAAHNALLALYNKAIQELAQERGARFVDLYSAHPDEPFSPKTEEQYLTANGIHLNEKGYLIDLMHKVSGAMNWHGGDDFTSFEPPGGDELKRDAQIKASNTRSQALRAAIIAKNDLYFHQWRPANSTYLFGFRKNEQGRNAAEMPQYDPLIEAAEKEIDRLKALPASAAAGTNANGAVSASPEAASAQPPPAPGNPAGSVGKSDAKAGNEQNETVGGISEPGNVSNPPHYRKSVLGGAAGDMGNRKSVLGGAAGDTGNRKSVLGGAAGDTGSRESVLGSAAGSTGNPNSQLPGAAGNATPATPPASEAAPLRPLPEFTIADGYEITLWAENPYLEKPTQMNWDAQGRLWVTSSSLYPMIAPGQEANDKVLILEDTDHDGKADKSTVFAAGLLVPTGVEPDLQPASPAPAGADATGDSKPRVSPGANIPQPSGLPGKDAKPAAPLQPGGLADISPGQRPGSPTPDGARPERAQESPALSLSDVPVVEPYANVEPLDLKHMKELIKPFDYKHSTTPRAACYVGQSTELLHFADTTGDGLADEKRIVLSGFGTEDTHHIIHTLHWGPDGRLFFNQSVYIHSHIETPWGIVRLNSGGIFAYDPRTERLEVFAKGWWNSWGHQMDAAGQSFATDGAGSTGISWVIPGGVYPAYEGGKKIAPPISPGSYPKFAGLELIYSPVFPADWQGNAITCDFRAHRVVRFAIEDLAKGEKPQAGYAAKEQPDFIRTNDVSFRPIDVKLGPDGALYIADWSNPVINHGEVDFRDPRRDHHSGRIWRVVKKGAPVVKWEPLGGKTAAQLAQSEQSENHWEKEQARRMQFITGGLTPHDALPDYASHLAYPDPRQKVLAIRALARIGTAKSAALVLDAAVKSEGDPFLEYAAWLSINDLAKPWTDAIASGEWKVEGHEKQLAYGLGAIEPSLASAAFSKLYASGKMPLDGSGPWIELIGKAGGPKELGELYRRLIAGVNQDGDPGRWGIAEIDDAALRVPGPVAARMAAALAEAARVRGVRPGSPFKNGKLEAWQLIIYGQREALGDVCRAMGYWKLDAMADFMATELASGPAERDEPLADAICEGLRALGSPAAARAVEALLDPAVAKGRQPFLSTFAEDASPMNRRKAFVTLATLNPAAAAKHLAGVLALPGFDPELVDMWRGLLAAKGFAETLPGKLPPALSKPVAEAGIRASREAGKRGEKLLVALAPLAGMTATDAKVPRDVAWMADFTKRDGDPVLGELVYRRATLGCTVCHAIGGAGGKVGPDMTSIGASAPLDYIIESVVNPAAKVKEGYNAVALTLRDGTVATGIQARETATEVFLRDAAGNEQSVVKANIASTQNIGSIMPAGLVDALPERERWNLFAFLAQLGKPGGFDASQGHSALVWTLSTKGMNDLVKPRPTVPVFTLTDGRLLREALAEGVKSLEGSEKVSASAQFQAGGKIHLTFTGVNKAWLDGQALAVASEPKVTADLAAGVHTITVELDAKALPDVLRVESPDARFLGN